MQFPFTLPRRKISMRRLRSHAVDHLVVVPEYPAYNEGPPRRHLQSAGGQNASAMSACNVWACAPLTRALPLRHGRRFGLDSLAARALTCASRR